MPTSTLARLVGIISEMRSDMRKILIYLAILALVHNGANAGLFGDDVDLADLSQLSPDALETLKDDEFKEYQKALHAETEAMSEAKNLRTKYEKISKQ